MTSVSMVEPRVLYVEDNLANIALMERLFKERPLVELQIAPDGQTARKLLSSAPPQLVLMDVNLPDTTGDELIVEIQHDLKDRTPPIVVVSADCIPSVIERFNALGIVEYLTKPYDVQHLFDIVDTYCTSHD